MAKFKVKYKEVTFDNKYVPKEVIVEADDEVSARKRALKDKGYDGIRRPRVFITDIQEVVEEDGCGATQTGNIAGPTSIFGTSGNKVDDVYLDLLNLEDYK